MLATILVRYLDQHACNLKTASDAKRTIRYWMEFHQEASISEALKPQRQKAFRDWLQHEKGLSLSSVRRALAVGKAGLNFAYKNGEIQAFPYVQLVTPPPSQPKGRPLEIEEVVKLFQSAKQRHVAAMMAMMIGTAGRTGAILDMTYEQIDLSHRLIDQNPSGRPQTKKHRPIVKVPDQLFEFLKAGKEANPRGPVVCYDGNSVACIKKSWRTTRKLSKLEGNVQTYSFRHTMARWMRIQSVPALEVQSQLGHKSQGFETTEIYAPFDPAHLSQACAAIDLFLYQVARQLRAKSISDYLLK